MNWNWNWNWILIEIKIKINFFISNGSFSARNRIYKEFDDQKILYERHGHGLVSRRYQIDFPDEKTSNRPTWWTLIWPCNWSDPSKIICRFLFIPFYNPITVRCSYWTLFNEHRWMTVKRTNKEKKKEINSNENAVTISHNLCMLHLLLTRNNIHFHLSLRSNAMHWIEQSIRDKTEICEIVYFNLGVYVFLIAHSQTKAYLNNTYGSNGHNIPQWKQHRYIDDSREYKFVIRPEYLVLSVLE